MLKSLRALLKSSATSSPIVAVVVQRVLFVDDVEREAIARLRLKQTEAASSFSVSGLALGTFLCAIIIKILIEDIIKDIS
jgi:hypothetical protein